uniref:Uncharacterized protein n=1 Tax=Panagrolaimus sp. PS1159 TaxID=55785 RepID=A0AC35FJV6_9BILA
MDTLEYQRTVLRPLVEELEKLYPTPSPKESSPDLPIMAIEVGNKFYILNQKTQELNEASLLTTTEDDPKQKYVLKPSLFPTTEDDSKQKYVLKRCVASTEEEKEEAAKLECVLKIIIGKHEYHVYDKQYLKIFKNL